MIHDNENVCICVQYVLIVCLNVLSTLFSYFSLTRKKKKIRTSLFYVTEDDFSCFGVVFA